MDKTELSKEITFRDCYDVLKRRRLPIVAIWIFVVTVVAIYTFLATKYYTATTQLMIEQSAQRTVSLQDAFAIDNSATDFYQTQFKLIQSRMLALRVIKALNLNENEDFADSNELEVRENNSSDKLIQELIDKFIEQLSVEPIMQSRLVNVSFTSRSPSLAAEVANTVAKTYIDYCLERKLAVSQMAVNFLSRRIEEQRNKLQGSEFALQKYMEEQKLVNVISDEYNTIVSNKLSDLEQSLIKAEVERKEAELRYKLAKKVKDNNTKFDSLEEILNSPVIQNIRKHELELASKEAELSQKYGSKHPKIMAIRAEKEALYRQKNMELSQIIVSLENQYKIAQSRENSLRTSLDHQKNEAMVIRKKAIAYSVLKKDVETNQKLYDMLLGRLKEARITEEIDVGMVTIIDRAQVPSSPSKPRVLILMSMAVFAGFTISILAAILMESIDNTIKLPSQVEDKLDMNLLGCLPFDEKLKFQVGLQKRVKATKIQDCFTEDIPTMDAMRMVAEAIMLSRAEKPPKIIVISSAQAGEGKSTIAAILAGILGEANRKTLLIDCDLRKPTQQKIWHLDVKKGMSTVLTGNHNLDETIVRNLMVNVDLIPAGPVPPTPARLFQSAMIRHIISAVEKSYDKIIIDCPPIIPVVEPILLGNLADGLVLVVAAGKTTTNMIKLVQNKVIRSGIDMYGIILNQTQKSATDYYYKTYYHSYSYSHPTKT